MQPVPQPLHWMVCPLSSKRDFPLIVFIRGGCLPLYWCHIMLCVLITFTPCYRDASFHLGKHGLKILCGPLWMCFAFMGNVSCVQRSRSTFKTALSYGRFQHIKRTVYRIPITVSNHWHNNKRMRTKLEQLQADNIASINNCVARVKISAISISWPHPLPTWMCRGKRTNAGEGKGVPVHAMETEVEKTKNSTYS